MPAIHRTHFRYWPALRNKIPDTTNPQQIRIFISNHHVDSHYCGAIKELSNSTDETISTWLDLNVKTYRNYCTHEIALGKQKQEQVVMLLSLFKHGTKVFGSQEKLAEWLNRENFFFSKKKPIEYFDTISGIKLVDDRLTAMEYGDNV